MDWIDAHHHLWDLSRVHYPWLMARGEARFFGQPDPIRRDYLIDDYLADTAGRIVRSVHIQVGARVEDELEETAFVAACSARTGGRLPAAAVPAIDMNQPDISERLEAQCRYPLVRGVRHMIGKSPEENASLPPFVSSVWRPNFQRLADAGLGFDLQLTEDQFEAVLGVLEQVPDLGVSICHLASPWDRSADGFRRWRAWMRRFAQLPNTYMKISGLSMFTRRWERDTFLAYGEAALDIFGARRCMLGSNFPVDRLYVDFDSLFDAWETLVGRCSEADREWLAGRTAERFYRL